MANRTVQAYFHQFFEEGFFHAAPHPGNIFVKAGMLENGPIIEFVDFGMVGLLSQSVMQAMKELFLSFVTRDSESMVKALTDLGCIGKGARTASLEQGLSLLIEQFDGMILAGVRELDIPAVVDEIERLLYDQPFQIPAQFTSNDPGTCRQNTRLCFCTSCKEGFSLICCHQTYLITSAPELNPK